MYVNLIRFADFFGDKITAEDFDRGEMFRAVPVGWTEDRVHVYCLNRYAREVWFRGELMGIIELEPK